jgi:ankyrin repeat protein
LNKVPPTRAMREHPDLDQLKRQAKELLEAFRAGEPQAVTEVSAYFRDANLNTFALHDAQLVLARAYGFQSWPKLKAYVDGVTAASLKSAVRAGDIEGVREMIRLRPELVNMNLSGFYDYPLHYAVLERRADIVRLLVEHGADPRSGTHGGPLAMATERGYEEIAAILRAADQNRPASLPTGQEADRPFIPDELRVAYRRGDEDQAIAMLEADPALVHAHRDGITPLHAAAALLLERMATWLIAHGADINACSKWGESPLDVVGCGKGYGRTGSPQQTQAMRDMLLANGARQTPRWAVMTSNAEWLRARHGEGTLGNPIYGDEGLLSLAVMFDEPDVLALLLDFGFDPDERRRLDLDPPEDTWGQPLRKCAETSRLKMAEMLLARGADPNGHIYASGTPLFVAYGQKDRAMIDLLERHGGYLDAELVGWLGLTDKAEQLLTNEAAGRLWEEAIPAWADGRPVAELLLIGGVNHPEILKLALPHITRTPDDPWWAKKLDESCGRGDLSCLQLLLEHCDVATSAPTILQAVSSGEWPQSQGFRPEEERVVKAAMLLDAGARLDTRDEWLKSTPLAHACSEGRIELVRLFLDRGADPVEADAEPWATPRAWAEKKGHHDVLVLLREYEDCE